MLLLWPIELSQSELKGFSMTKRFDLAKIGRLTEIKEEILDLLDEAVSLVRGTSEEQRANHWYAPSVRRWIRTTLKATTPQSPCRKLSMP